MKTENRAAPQEVDLRDYIDILRRHAGLLGLVLLVALVAALAYSFLQPRVYEATALVLITKRPYQLQFDTRFSMADVPASGKALAILVKSPGVEVKVLEAMGEALPPELRSIGALDGLAQVSQRDDPALLKLMVRHPNAPLAAQIANTWAEVAAKALSELYGQTDRAEASAKEQLQAAAANLRGADEALVNFERQSSLTQLQSEASVSAYYIAQLRAAQNAIDLTIKDAQRLKEQLAATGGTAAGAATAELLLQALVLRWTEARGQLPEAKPAAGTPMSPAGPAPPSIQFQIPLATGTDLPLEQRLKNLDAFIASLERQREELSGAVKAEAARLKELRAQLTAQMVEEERLKLARDTAQKTHTVLSNRVDEARVAATSELRAAQVASRALVPPEPASQGLPLNLGIGVALGLVIGVLGAFATEYWEKSGVRRAPAPVLEPARRGQSRR